MKNNYIKKKLINHIMKNGNKKTCEKIVLKSFKILQKSTIKSHKKILKLSIINSTSSFRIFKLKRKKRKKKNSKEIPKFIYNSSYRISWALKFISQVIKKKISNKYYKNLKHEIIITSKNEENTYNKSIHQQAITQKRVFFYFRW